MNMALSEYDFGKLRDFWNHVFAYIQSFDELKDDNNKVQDHMYWVVIILTKTGMHSSSCQHVCLHACVKTCLPECECVCVCQHARV